MKKNKTTETESGARREGISSSLEQRLHLQLSSPQKPSYEEALMDVARLKAEKAKLQADYNKLEAKAAQLESHVLVTEQEKADLEDKAYHDALTGLNNQRYWLEKAPERYARTSHMTKAVITIDIDDFHDFNEKYGHDAGDEVLKSIGNALRGPVGTLRHTDDITRSLGEEFNGIFYDIREDKKDVDKRMESLKRYINLVIRRETGYHVTVSIGAVVCRPEDDISLDDARKLADNKLYEAKRSGKNQFKIVYDLQLEAA